MKTSKLSINLRGLSVVALGAFFLVILAFVSPNIADAATITRSFDNQFRTSTVFDFGVLSQSPRINVEAIWCWEDGGNTGCFNQVREVAVGETGLIYFFNRDDGGRGTPGPSCSFVATRSDTHEYCMEIYSSGWDGRRLILDWQGLTDRNINLGQGRGFLTRISVDSTPQPQSQPQPQPQPQPQILPPSVSLFLTPSTISSGGFATLSWTSQNTISCTASGGWSGARSLLGNESVSPPQGTSYTIVCSNSLGSQVSQTVTLTVLQSQSPSISLVVSPSSIIQGSFATLSWTSQNTISCTASGGWSGARSLSGNESVSPSSSTAYTLVCQNFGGQQTSQTAFVNVSQAQAPTVSLAVAPAAFPAGGGAAVLSWNTQNASLCTASGGWSGARSLSGSESINVVQTTSYILSCVNNSGLSNSDTEIVTVSPAAVPTLSLVISPTSMAQGGTAVLTWSGQNVTTCSVSGGWSGTRAISGSENTTPLQTTAYSMSCTNATGQTVSQSVTLIVQVQLASVNLSVSQTSVTSGSSVTLTWSSQNATSCNAFGGWSGSRGLSGSESVSVGQTTSYVMVCANASGSTSDSETVFIQQTPIYPRPTISFSVSPQVITPGNSAVLLWSTQSADSCFASGGWSGQKSTSASETISPSLTTTYSIVCTGPGGTASESRTLVVQSVLGISTVNAILQVSNSLRNVNLNTPFSGIIEAESLDVLEARIVLQNTSTQGIAVSVRNQLPGELTYTPGTTKINGTLVNEGITGVGLALGTLNPGEQKIITFQAVVLNGISSRTLTNQVIVTNGGGTSNASATINIRNRGRVLGAGDVSTGPGDRIALILVFGLASSLLLYLVSFKLRFRGKAVRSIVSDFKLQSVIRNLRQQERGPDA